MDEAVEESRYSTKHLVQRYILALFLIAVLVVSSHYYVEIILYTKTSYADIINLAGRQRMLSQKIAVDSLLIARGENKESYLDSLASDTANLTKVHDRLIRNNTRIGLRAEFRDEIGELLAKIEPYRKRLTTAARAILALDGVKPPVLAVDSAIIAEIVETSESYMELMDQIVREYELEARDRHIYHERVETLIMFSVLLLLVVVALLIFRPMVKKVHKTYAAIRRVNESLTAEIWERKQAEERLTEHKFSLEERVAERTTELTNLNQALQNEIIKRTMTEEELQTAKQLLEKTFASLNEAVFVTNPENRTFIACNPAVQRLFGYTKEEVIGRNSEFLHVDKASYQKFGREVLSAVESNGYYHGEYRLKKKDGTVFTSDFTITEIRDESGKCTELVGAVSDITEKRLMEEELARSQKLESLGLLAGGIAHDFNNILMGILGNISIAKFLTGSNNRSLKVLSEAEKAALRAKSLTNQLLTFSSGSTLLMKVTRINNFLKDITHFALRGSNSKAEVKTAKNLALLNIDGDQITQVINNLVINADQAMPDGGVVKVYADNIALKNGEKYPLPAGDYVKISVEDSGIGIADENLDRIFDPFFTTKNKGSGLGLSSSYSIVKNHGGLIKVSSKPGEGSTFNVYLPAIDKPAPRNKKKVKTIKGTENILIMDDDEMVREVLLEMLTELGYKPMTAKDGKEAVEKYQRAMKKGTSFAAVILDHTIKGGMGGIKTIEKLKEIDPNVNAIISSGYTTGVFMTNYKKFGFSDFVAKPYELETLSQLLDKTITAKRQLSVLPQLGLS